jgi:hypothetical protein
MNTVEFTTNPRTGKLLRKSYLNAIAAATLLGFTFPAEPARRVNPFSGVACTLTPPAVFLYDFITTHSFTCGIDYTRQAWDNARYCFLECWPDEYYKLID